MNRRIVAPRISDNFRFQWRYFGITNNLRYNTQLFNNFNFMVVLVFACALAGFFKPLFWALGLALLGLMIFLYFKTARLCEGISLVRTLPTVAREQQTLEVKYTVTNDSAFSVAQVEFIEEFDGVQSGAYTVSLPRGLAAHTRTRVSKKLLLNGGMGVKRLGIIELLLRDELGLFEFTLQFGPEKELVVYPRLEESPVLRACVSPEAIEFGFFEIAKRGDSNLFIGVRDYRAGDPVRHINWRLSQKSRKLVLNEFEKNTNTFVTLLLELDFQSQIGSGGLSTWEAMKDIALSIASNEIARHNQVQVLAHNLHLGFSTGRSHLELLERHLAHHELKPQEEKSAWHALEQLPAQGQIYYLAPMVTTPRVLAHLELIERLVHQRQRVTIFFIDPYEELIRTVKSELRVGMMELERLSRAEFSRLEERFKQMGVTIATIKVSGRLDLRNQFLTKARELLEGK